MPDDPEFPEDCMDDPDDPCPDPDRDQNALADALDVLDGVALTDGIAGSLLNPFELRTAKGEIKINGTFHSYQLAGDGLKVEVGGTMRTIEWGTHDGGSRWHTHRVSLDGGPLRTLTAA